MRLPQPIRDCILDLLPLVYTEVVRILIENHIKDHGMKLSCPDTDILLLQILMDEM